MTSSWTRLAVVLAAAVLVVTVTAATVTLLRAPPSKDLVVPGDAVFGSLAAVRDEPGLGQGLVVVGDGRRLDVHEVDAVMAFAARGGRVLVLGDDDVARRAGIPVAETPVVGSDRGIRAIFTVADQTVNALLVDARPVLASPDADVIAVTSSDAFVDVDGDGHATRTDVAGPFVVAARQGPFLVVGSAAALQSEARESLLGAAFPPGTEVLLDRTRGTSPFAVPLVGVLGGVEDAWASPARFALAAALLAAALLVAFPRRGLAEGPSEDLDAPLRPEEP